MDDTQASMYQHFIGEATSTVKQAISEDTAGNTSIAVGLYVSATVLYMKALEFVQDEEFKKRVKVEVAKYLQRAKDLRVVEQQNPHLVNQEAHSQNQYLQQHQQKMQHVQQQHQNFRDQRQQLQEYWNAPPQPLPQSQPLTSKQPSHSPTPSHTQSTSPQPPHTTTNTQKQETPHTTGILGNLLNKVKNSGNPPKTKQRPKKSTSTKKQKAKKGSDEESDEEEEEEEEEESSEEEESEDEEGNARVEELVKEVEREEGKEEGGDKSDKEEKEKEKVDTKREKEKEEEEEEEEIVIPDEETLKTYDKMLMEEEKRVNAELRQTSVTDDKIADKIASLGYGMGLGLNETQEGELDDEALKDIIMESRIEALGMGGTTTKKPAKAKKKPK